MIRTLIFTCVLTGGCAVPHDHVLYTAASGAAMVCDVIAGVIKHCQETPHREVPHHAKPTISGPAPSVTPEHQHDAQ